MCIFLVGAFVVYKRNGYFHFDCDCHHKTIKREKMRSICIIVSALLLSFATVIDGFVCPRDGYFANPDNEHGYFKCVAGMLFHATCALDLLWIQRDQKCGWTADQGMFKSVFLLYTMFFRSAQTFPDHHWW